MPEEAFALETTREHEGRRPPCPMTRVFATAFENDTKVKRERSAGLQGERPWLDAFSAPRAPSQTPRAAGLVARRPRRRRRGVRRWQSGPVGLPVLRERARPRQGARRREERSILPNQRRFVRCPRPGSTARALGLTSRGVGLRRRARRRRTTTIRPGARCCTSAACRRATRRSRFIASTRTRTTATTPSWTSTSTAGPTPTGNKFASAAVPGSRSRRAGRRRRRRRCRR